MAITISGSGITSANIADGTIVNADVNSSAAIDASKLTGVGKVLQTVAFVEDSSSQTLATSTYTDTNLSVSITPTLSTSKILCAWNIQVNLPASPSESAMNVKLLRDSTAVYSESATAGILKTSSGMFRLRGSWMALDSPATTSAITYKVQVASDGSKTIYINGDGKAQLMLMEIGV